MRKLGFAWWMRERERVGRSETDHGSEFDGSTAPTAAMVMRRERAGGRGRGARRTRCMRGCAPASASALCEIENADANAVCAAPDRRSNKRKYSRPYSASSTSCASTRESRANFRKGAATIRGPMKRNLERKIDVNDDGFISERDMRYVRKRPGEPASMQLNHGVKKVKMVRGGSLGHILAGALAGAVSRSAVAPLETVRLRQMVQGKGSALGAALDLVRGEGIGAFWRGNLANVSKAAPQKAIDFFTYDLLKQAITPRIGSGLMVSVQLFSGAVAGITSCVVLYPLENLRARLAVGSMKPAGVLSSLSMIARKEGLGSLYRGLGTSVCAIVPEAAITYGLFDILRQAGAEHYSNVNPELRAVGSGVVASLAGTIAAYPIETIARRLQTSSSSLRLSTAFAEAMKAGGPRALYCGIVPMTLKVTPMAAISFFTYETVQGWLERFSDGSSTSTTRKEDDGDESRER